MAQWTVSRFLKSAAIIFAAWFVYAPAFHGEFLGDWDDAVEITQNPVLRDPAGLGKIWLAPQSMDYYPLKTSVQWIEWQLWGLNPLGYHLVNVALHVLSALLIWHGFRKLGLRYAWTGALLFVVHPLTVESVAWIVELKNALSLPLLLLAMGSYLDFDRGISDPSHAKAQRRKEIHGGGNLRAAGSDFRSSVGLVVRRIGLCAFAPLRETGLGSYLLSLGLFLAAMLTKTSVVMFPFVLLLYACWRRGRIGRRDLLASAPFFAVSLTLGLVTLWLQRHVVMQGLTVPVGGLSTRMAVEGLAAAFYFWKFVAPFGLAPMYPRWPVDPPSALQFLPWVVIVLVFWLLVAQARRLPSTKTAGGDACATPISGFRFQPSSFAKDAVFGLGWFLLFLLPVSGLITIATMRFTWVMDHFAYVSLVGLVGAAAAAAAKAEGEIRKSKTLNQFPLFAFRFSLFLLLAALAIQSRRYAAIYHDRKALWTYAVAQNPDAWLARTELGNILADEGRLAEAKVQVEATLRLQPNYAPAENNLGNILVKAGHPEEAIAHYERAAQLNPGYFEVHMNLGDLLFNDRRYAEAVVQYEDALRLNPAYARGQANLKLALRMLGRK